MSDVIKLSKEQLAKLKDFKVKNDQIVLQLGQVDVQRAILEGQRGVILEKLAELQEESKSTAEDLQKKYGDGNIHLETVEFTLVKKFFERFFNIYNKTILKIIYKNGRNINISRSISKRE